MHNSMQIYRFIEVCGNVIHTEYQNFDSLFKGLYWTVISFKCVLTIINWRIINKLFFILSYLMAIKLEYLQVTNQ